MSRHNPIAWSRRVGGLLAVFAATHCATGVDPEGPPGATPTAGQGPGVGGGANPGAGGFGSGGRPASGGAGTGSAGSGAGGALPSAGGSAAGGVSSMGGSGNAGQGSGGVPPPPPAIGDLVVQYAPLDEPNNNTLKPQISIDNRGTMSVPLALLTARYWYTADGPAGSGNYQELTVDYADIGRLTDNRVSVRLSFGAVEPAQPGADHYLEIGFDGPDDLAPGASTNQIDIRVNWPGYTPNYDETDDYSWDGSLTTRTDWPNVTLYQGGVLVWGREPDGTVPMIVDGGAPPAGDGGAAAAMDSGVPVDAAND